MQCRHTNFMRHDVHAWLRSPLSLTPLRADPAAPVPRERPLAATEPFTPFVCTVLGDLAARGAPSHCALKVVSLRHF